MQRKTVGGGEQAATFKFEEAESRRVEEACGPKIAKKGRKSLGDEQNRLNREEALTLRPN